MFIKREKPVAERFFMNGNAVFASELRTERSTSRLRRFISVFYRDEDRWYSV